VCKPNHTVSYPACNTLLSVAFSEIMLHGQRFHIGRCKQEFSFLSMLFHQHAKLSSYFSRLWRPFRIHILSFVISCK